MNEEDFVSTPTYFDEQPAKATAEEIRRSRIRCWHSTCLRRAWFEDWAGWRWCPYHMYWSWRWGGGSIWQELKHIRFYWGGW